MQKIGFGTQKIVGLLFRIFKIVIVSFQVINKLGNA